jgi:hypothetical protein
MNVVLFKSEAGLKRVALGHNPNGERVMTLWYKDGSVYDMKPLLRSEDEVEVTKRVARVDLDWRVVEVEYRNYQRTRQ